MPKCVVQGTSGLTNISVRFDTPKKPFPIATEMTFPAFLRLVKGEKTRYRPLSLDAHDLDAPEQHPGAYSQTKDSSSRLLDSTIELSKQIYRWIVLTITGALLLLSVASVLGFVSHQSICRQTSSTSLSIGDRQHFLSPDQSTYLDLEAPGTRSFLLASQGWNYTHPLPSPCGDSPKSARAAGCKFSAMTFGWYPPACYDDDLETEFLELDDWAWYSDKSMANDTILPRDPVINGEIEHAWVSMRFHDLHCMYSMRKLLRAAVGVTMLDNYIVRMGHMHHCEQLMYVEAPDSLVNLKGDVAQGVTKYFDCYHR